MKVPEENPKQIPQSRSQVFEFDSQAKKVKKTQTQTQSS